MPAEEKRAVETRPGAGKKPGVGGLRAKWQRRLAWGLGIPGALIALVVAGDFGYSRYVSAGYREWNRTIERDAGGVREGCREFTLGEGGTAILMIHGFGSSPAVWRTMAAALAAEGFTCRAMRLPGFAMPIEKYGRTSLARWRQALSSEMRALGERHRRIFIVAHSMGGTLAVDYALDRPDSPAGIVLLAPLVEVSGERSPVLSPRTWHWVSECALHFTDLVVTPFEADCRDPGMREGIKAEPYTPRSVYRSLFALVDRISGRAGELRTPMLMALSPHDRVIDSEAAARYFKASPADPKQLVYMSEAGHVLPVDYGRRDLAVKIADFIRDLAAGSG